MHVRNIRKLREDGSGPGDGSSGSARSRSSQLSRADGSPRKRRPSTLSISMDESVASVMSPASPLPALTLDVEEYLNLLAGKHDTTASAKLTAHLSAEELQEQLAMGEQELVDTKKRGACIVKSISLLKKLEAAVSASLEEDAFAERLIRHQQDLVQRARAERGDQSLREKNLTKDVEKLERNYQRGQEPGGRPDPAQCRPRLVHGGVQEAGVADAGAGEHRSSAAGRHGGARRKPTAVRAAAAYAQ